MRPTFRGKILACCLLLTAVQVLAQEVVRIGVQAYRPKPQVLAQWAPLAPALDKAIPGYHFVVEAYTVDELTDVVASRQIDFILTNPSQFVLMDHLSGLTAPLVSLSNLEQGRPLTAFGGVIFIRAGRSDIQRLEDLKGKIAAAISLNSFGGYQMQAFELHLAGLDLPQDVRLKITNPPQDKVVEAVLSGQADVGFVRSGLLEDLAKKGKLDLARIKVLHQRDLPGYPYLVSTSLYPEWVLAAMPQTDNNLKRRLASFLLNVQDDKALAQALGIYGFDVPADYTAVENLLSELRLPPYDVEPAFSLKDVWDRYQKLIIAAFIAGALLVLLALRLLVSNRRLHHSELRFRTVANFTYDWEYWTGADGEILYMSPSCQRITGYSAQEFADNPDFLNQIVLPEDRHLLASHIKENAYHEAALLEFRIKHRDGSIRWIAHGCRAVFGPDGQPLGRRVSNRDDTKRKELEIATRQFEAIVQSSNDAIISKTLDGIITSWNPGAEALFGYRAEEMIGHPSTVLFPTDRMDEEKHILERITQGETVDHFETIRIRKDGSKVDISATISPIHDEAGKIVGASKVARDITERKRMQEELTRYKDHLEQEVQQRTADLVLARDAAEEANKAKSIFLANMSHELRTPLNAILGFSSMMRKDDTLSQKERDNLDIINRSGDHLLNLINDVLEMSKIEAGRVQLEIAPFDLGSLVRDVAGMMEIRAREKGLQLLVDQSSHFPRFIKGDESRLRQILINLLGNAIKFTDHGGVTLRLGTRENSTSHLVMEVEDSGIGIRPEDQQKIFEPFVQLGTVAAQQGTGLGLTLIRQYLQLMGGSIKLESTPGKGSIFRVDLPIDRVEAGEMTQMDKLVKGDVLGLAPGQPAYRILIVEDQLENQLLLTQLMESVGFEVKVAENGEQGVAMFQDWHPHLIWMDRRMPVMDGMDATRAIRTLPGGHDVRIVAVTASAFMEQRDEMLAAGMDDFVRKPYRFNEIYDCLTRQLGVQYRYAEASPAAPSSEVQLTPDMLKGFPPALQGQLRTALQSLQEDHIHAVIEQIAAQDAPLSKIIARLAENYDYPAILKALQDNPSDAAP